MTLTEEQFKQLQAGDVVKGKSSGNTFIVQANYGNRVTAVKIADMTDPAQWDLISKVTERKSQED
jgi:hypothetical protein